MTNNCLSKICTTKIIRQSCLVVMCNPDLTEVCQHMFRCLCKGFIRQSGKHIGFKTE